MNFGFNPLPPFSNPFQTPFMGPGRNSLAGMNQPFPPYPQLYPQPLIPPMFYPNLKSSFNGNCRGSFSGNLRSSQNNGTMETQLNGYNNQQYPVFNGGPFQNPGNLFYKGMNGSFGTRPYSGMPINSAPMPYNYPTTNYQFNGQTSNSNIKTENNLQNNDDMNIQQLISYQDELKSVKSKIDAMYEQAIMRSQASIEIQQKNLESIKGSQNLMFKEYQASPINHHDHYNSAHLEHHISNGGHHHQKSNQINQENDINSDEEQEFEDYDGEKLSGLKHGSGKMVYSNGLIYTGSWEKDKKHGFGILTNSEGEQIYAGDWKYDAFDGQGLLNNLDSQTDVEPTYTVEDLNNAWNHWSNYEGEFKDGRMHGMGILSLCNGEKYNGKFMDGMIHGEGSYYKSNGETIIGIWSENIIIKKL